MSGEIAEACVFFAADASNAVTGQRPMTPAVTLAATVLDWTGLFQFGAECSRDCVARLRSDLLRRTRPWPAGAALGVREREEKRTERTLCTRPSDAKVKVSR